MTSNKYSAILAAIFICAIRNTMECNAAPEAANKSGSGISTESASPRMKIVGHTTDFPNKTAQVPTTPASPALSPGVSTESTTTLWTNEEPTTVFSTTTTQIPTTPDSDSPTSNPDMSTTSATTNSKNEEPTTVFPITTTKSPVTPPNCKRNGEGRYPAKYCNQYYQCLERKFPFLETEYKRVLRTCPDDLIFEVSSESCVVGTCTPKSVAPDCKMTRKMRFPAENCREFYECSVFYWPFWPLIDYDLTQKACKPDEVFDARKMKCIKGSCK